MNIQTQQQKINQTSFQLNSDQSNLTPHNNQQKLNLCKNQKNFKINQLLNADKIVIQDIIKQLKTKGSIEEKKLNAIIQLSQNILQNQPNVLKIVSPIYIVGDIHGQFYDLLYIFEQNKISQKKYLFLGDYVDRGLFCIQVITLLLSLKIKYPKNIFLLRGNHQGRVMTTNFNFKTQCQSKYKSDMYQKMIDLFSKLPLCAIIDHTYFCVHGGISPDVTKINQLQKLNRFVQIQSKGIICDLMWSDPSEDSVMTWQNNQMRGCSYFYSKIQAKQFLKQNKVKLIIRGHQVQLEGFKYQKSNSQQKLTLTIFSAPNYCDTYRNKGAIAFIQKNQIQLKKFNESAHPFVFPNYLNCFQFSIPSLCQLAGKIFIYLIKNKRNSKRRSILDDQTLEQINAIQRVQIINKIIAKKIQQNQDFLFQKIINQENNAQIDLTKSYQIAFEAFINKKFSDSQQMYPIDPRIRKLTNQILKKQVFGPKIKMKNNIMKKQLNQQQNDLKEYIQ